MARDSWITSRWDGNTKTALLPVQLCMFAASMNFPTFFNIWDHLGLLETNLRYYMDFHNAKIIAKKNNMVINITKLKPV